LIIRFGEQATTLFPQEESFYSHNERSYVDKNIADLKTEDFCSLPVLFSENNHQVVFTETALHDYPGMFLEGSEENGLRATFPKYVLKAVPNEENSPDRNQLLVEEADYIGQIPGKQKYPWRVFVMASDDKDLIESNLTYQLSEPTEEKNWAWVKPGKVAWDWYNANNVFGVDFKAGLNTETYKYYIDFAAANGIEYVILDEGWTKFTTEILDTNPDIDVTELIEYGKQRNVSIILWVLWKPLDENMTEILETYQKWGAKGIKVDFMQRNDQYMVSSYEKIAQECARLHLLVDFHGAFKPSGLRRKYPNVINYEGVRGNENNKWSADITPKHNVTIPFIRMVAGPMDFTPGAMANAHFINYAVSFDRPMALGTRAHQVAMYVVYEAPLQMLCESPTVYYKEQETVDFITEIPTVWDETKALHGKVGDHIALARKKDEVWYVGAMTGNNAQELLLDLSFLDAGTFEATIYSDGANADRYAPDYKIEKQIVDKDTVLKANMVKGGGWSAIIRPIAENP
jgi:alpha-glucosidase